MSLLAWPRRIVFIRHGESVGNALKHDDAACAFDHGTNRYALTERGRQQSVITGTHLRKHFGEQPFDVVFASHFLRAQQTAEAAFPGTPVIIDERLAERNRGLRHVLTEDAYFEHYPEEDIRRRREGLFHWSPVGGESCAQMMLRIRSFLLSLRVDHADQSVAIVGHCHWWLCCRLAFNELTIEEVEHCITAGRLIKNAAYAVYETPQNGRPVRSHEEVVPWAGILDDDYPSVAS